MRQCCFCKRGSNCSIQAPEVSPAFLARVSLSDAGGLWLLGDTATRWFSRRSDWFVTTSRPVAVDRDQERAACKRQWTTAIQAGGWAWFFPQR
jgi:hypothetical protein